MSTKKLCVGLFGTCGGSAWRDAFLAKYEEKDIPSFNPQKADWKPEDAADEADHLANDAVILFPVTGETYGTGSLAEAGFSILQAIRLDDRRDFVIMIEAKPDVSLDVDDPEKKFSRVAYKESCRARALVIQHLKKQRLSNLYVVESLHEMLEISVLLYETNKLKEPLAKYNLK